MRRTTKKEVKIRMEWQNPTDYTDFDNMNGELYRIKLKYGSEMRVNEKYKAYASLHRSSDNLDLLNISTFDCFNNSLSSDTKAALIFKDNAKKSISLGCSGRSSNASGILSEYPENAINLTAFFNRVLNSSNSDDDSFVFLHISDLCLSNSSRANSGEHNSCSLRSNLVTSDPLQKKLNNELVSSISFIYTIPCCFNLFNLSCFADSPSLCASSSVNSDRESFVSRNSTKAILCINSAAAFLNTSDQLTVFNVSILCFKSSGTDIVTLGIFDHNGLTQKSQYSCVYKYFDKSDIELKMMDNTIEWEMNENKMREEKIGIIGWNECTRGFIRKVEVDNRKHNVYASVNWVTSNFSSYKTMSLPLKSFESNSLSSFEKESISNSSLFCETLIQTSENSFSLVNPKKSSSFVTNTLSSDLENSASLPLESPFGLNTTSYSSDFRNSSNFFLTFSSNKNLGLFGFHSNDDIVPAFGYSGCIVQSCFNLLFCEWGYETCNYFFDRDTCFKHFQDLPNHDSCAFESRFTMANLTVCNNILVNFDSHNISNSGDIYKHYDVEVFDKPRTEMHGFLEALIREKEAYLIAQMSFFRNRLDYGEDVPFDFYEENKDTFEKIIEILLSLIGEDVKW